METNSRIFEASYRVVMRSVVSSNVTSVGYDVQSHNLYVMFGEKLYRYALPKETNGFGIITNLLEADSVGSKVRELVKGLEYSQVDHSELMQPILTTVGCMASLAQYMSNNGMFKDFTGEDFKNILKLLDLLVGNSIEKAVKDLKDTEAENQVLELQTNAHAVYTMIAGCIDNPELLQQVLRKHYNL
jgi:hypothetical protein